VPVRLLFQEQSLWVAASVPEAGWLRFASADQLRSFQNALVGFYRKSGIDLVREQIETNFLHQHPYDINSGGFVVWPNADFSNELTVHVDREGPLRAFPATAANVAGILATERSQALFWESATLWSEWNTLWSGESAGLRNSHSSPVMNDATPASVPPACIRKSEIPVMQQIH
ncbi:MAG: hypothetical protein ACK58L_08455, partial [Planctomycetota bacterium]